MAIHDDFRSQALAEALRRRSDLASKTDAASLALLQQLADDIERELRLRAELDEVRRRQFAEEAARRGAEARAAREAKELEKQREFVREQRLALEKEKAKKKLREEEQRARLAALPPFRRWIARWWPVASVGLALVIAASVGGIVMLQSNAREERQTIEAALARQEAAEQRLQAELVACDPIRSAEGDTPQELLTAWASCLEPEVRAALAQNPAISRSTQDVLASDPEQSVRSALAQNPAISRSTHDVLASDPEQSVRSALAGNEALPLEIAQQLLRDSSLEVRHEIARNSALAFHDQLALPPCREGGLCELGDTGPGGGRVFFVSETPRSWGSYLEAAPKGWSGSQSDPKAPWCAAALNTRESFPQVVDSVLTGRGVGTGLGATQAVIASCGENSAAAIAASFGSGEIDNWYLPSDRELRYLYTARRLVGGLERTTYWSSSGFWPSYSNRPATLAWDFVKGVVEYSPPRSRLSVRPIRAFGPTSPSSGDN